MAQIHFHVLAESDLPCDTKFDSIVVLILVAEFPFYTSPSVQIALGQSFRNTRRRPALERSIKTIRLVEIRNKE